MRELREWSDPRRLNVLLLPDRLVSLSPRSKKAVEPSGSARNVDVLFGKPVWKKLSGSRRDRPTYPVLLCNEGFINRCGFAIKWGKALTVFT